MSEILHVVPVEDLREHICNGVSCHCKPSVQGELVVHNSYDGREFFEQDDIKEQGH